MNKKKASLKVTKAMKILSSKTKLVIIEPKVYQIKTIKNF